MPQEHFGAFSNLNKLSTFQPVTQIYIPMLKSYIKIAIRGLTRDKLFTGINILSLAIGMSVSLVVISMIFDLLKFDAFHENKDRIYRVISNVNYGNYGIDTKASTVLPVVDQLKTYPGIEHIVQIQKRLNETVDTPAFANCTRS